MEPKKELTKELIAASMKEIMLRHPFEKITIRMITEHAGVIRPTFYYHFQDKYEVLEWVVRQELINSIRVLMQRGMVDEAMHVIFATVDDDREFYKRAFAITGQNGFSEIMVGQVRDFLMELIDHWGVTAGTGIKMLSNKMLCTHCAINFVSMVYIWIIHGHDHATADEMSQSFLYLVRHTYYECFTKTEQTDSGE